MENEALPNIEIKTGNAAEIGEEVYVITEIQLTDPHATIQVTTWLPYQDSRRALYAEAQSLAIQTLRLALQRLETQGLAQATE